MSSEQGDSILIISDDEEDASNATNETSETKEAEDPPEQGVTRNLRSTTRTNNFSRKSTTKSAAQIASETAAANAAAQRNQSAMKRLRRLMSETKFLKDFNPETSKREKNKLTKKLPMEYSSTNNKYYDKNGAYSDNGQDLCDCLRLTCCGCFFPCLKCGSTKCGTKCRVMRKWMYESVVFDGADESLRNPLLFKPRHLDH
ncbi:ARL14 effector protein [Sergentomyia squamirostris]